MVSQPGERRNGPEHCPPSRGERGKRGERIRWSWRWCLGSDGGEEGGTADEGQGDAMRLVGFANAVRARSGQAVEAGQGASASGEEGGARGGSGGVGAVGVDLGVEGETRRGITERLQEAAGSKVLVGLAVTEFGSDADARYAALTVAIAKQMLDIGIKDLDDPRFVLTAGEVVRWQSPFWYPPVV